MNSEPPEIAMRGVCVCPTPCRFLESGNLVQSSMRNAGQDHKVPEYHMESGDISTFMQMDSSN